MIPNRLSVFFVGFYAWIVTVQFGAVLLDIIYSKLIADATAAFSEVADLLLLFSTITVISAIAAITFSWKSRIARNYLTASVVILLLQFFVPLFFAQLMSNVYGSVLTTTIRILITGSVSVLAMIGLYQFSRQR